VQTNLLDATDDAVITSEVNTGQLAQARRLVALFAEVTTSKDVEKFLSGFTDDCVVAYAQFPIIYGKAQFHPFVESMFSPKLRDFICHKTLRSLNGNIIGGTWIAEWTDADSGKKKIGRGFEFWIMRDNKIARRDAAFNSWDAAKEL
jgi:SnoaL-like domain